MFFVSIEKLFNAHLVEEEFCYMIKNEVSVTYFVVVLFKVIIFNGISKLVIGIKPDENIFLFLKKWKRFGEWARNVL